MKISDRGKRICYLIGITIGVYLSFRYLLPLVIPFFIAYLGASLISPIVGYMEKHWKVKRVVGTILVIVVFLGIFGTFSIWFLQKLMEQAGRFFSNFYVYEDAIRQKLCDICCGIEEKFGFQQNSVQFFMTDGVTKLTRMIEENAMPTVVSNSVPAMKWICEAIALIFIIIVSMVFVSRDLEKIKERQKKFVFYKEFSEIEDKLAHAGGAYLKTQFILMLITATVCMIGLSILRNGYALLIGATIGVLDALPLIGSGLFFIPWIIISFLFGNWKQGVGLLIIYLICYFTREFLEPRLMGKQIGISELEMIISMYIGIKLFGLMGVLLGPVGYLLIEDIMVVCLKE